MFPGVGGMEAVFQMASARHYYGIFWKTQSRMRMASFPSASALPSYSLSRLSDRKLRVSTARSPRRRESVL